jgi:hypothetical protein
MNKIKLNVVKEEKIDNRVNNTGRPVNKKSARQVRLAKQALYTKLNKQFVSGVKFKINNSNTEYVYNVSAVDKLRKNAFGHISGMTGHVCNVDYIGRTKVTGYTFVLDKRVNVEINLKEVTFVK